ncbi:hypothetical protein [Eudoraea sp.]|uniref:hypothetical protein n=1 Tax=Eudoraea sp. TaxID=1979955 RepID=UPI003C707BAE
MKKLGTTLVLAFVLALTTTLTINAQSNDEEVDFVQSIFGMEKKEAVADFLDLETADPFWALYDEYELQRKELGKRRLALLENYVDNYDNLSDEATDALLKEGQAIRNGNNKLIDKYHKKIKKVSGSKRAAQFYQIESYIQSAIRYGILEGIPFLED